MLFLIDLGDATNGKNPSSLLHAGEGNGACIWLIRTRLLLGEIEALPAMLALLSLSGEASYVEFFIMSQLPSGRRLPSAAGGSLVVANRRPFRR